MTDYLEEHLGNAETLLARIRQMEQSASGLTAMDISTEDVRNMGALAEKTQYYEAKSEIVSEGKGKVYNTETVVNQTEKIVDNTGIGSEIREKERDEAVNHQTKTGDNSRDPEQMETSAQGKGAQTNLERAERRSPLSVQLEELDRAVSALTPPIPEGREAARSGYPISLSPAQGTAADPSPTVVPGEAWSSPAAAAGAGFAYGGAQLWAEQVDRMFRRDSRRYDGGFYLY